MPMSTVLNFLKKGSLVLYTVIFAILGIALGFVLSSVNVAKYPILMAWLVMPGMLFVRSLTCLVIPLVFASVITGVASLFEVGSSMKKVGGLTIAYYFFTTIVAVILGILSGNVVRLIVKEDQQNIGISPASAYWDDVPTLTVFKNDWTQDNSYFSSATATTIEYKLSNDNTVRTAKNLKYHYEKKILFSLDKIVKDIGPLRDVVVKNSAGEITFEVPAEAFTINDYEATNEISESFLNLLNSLFPNNFVGTLSGCPEGGCSPQLLSLITFAILAAIYISMNFADDKEDPGRKHVVHLILPLIEECLEVLMCCIRLVLLATPFAVMTLIASAIGSSTLSELREVMKTLGIATATMLACFLFQVLVVYNLICFIVTRKNPFLHILQMRQPISIAIATASSASVFPANLQACLDVGLSPPIVRFVLSLGATINMDGVAIMVPNIVLWLAQISGESVNFTQSIMLGIVATLTSAGASPVPGLTPYVLMSWTAVFSGKPVPLQISYFIALDWFIDRCLTTVNILGDSYGVRVIDHFVAEEIAAEQEAANERN